MDYEKHRTPSGLPPANFQESEDWRAEAMNDLDLILKIGVWAPTDQRLPRPALTPPAAQPSPTLSQWMFTDRPQAGGCADVITWWERRRWAYNAILLLSGLAAAVILWGAYGLFAPKLGGVQSTLNPVAPPLNALGIGIAIAGANAIYTALWLTELTALAMTRGRCAGIGPALLRGALVVGNSLIAYVFIGTLHSTLCGY